MACTHRVYTEQVLSDILVLYGESKVLQVKIIKTQTFFIKNFTYLVFDDQTQHALLVDPAWDMQAYDSALTENNLMLAGILITHHHMDHTDLAGKLAKKYNCPAYMSQSEAQYYNFSCYNLELIPDNVESLSIAGIKVGVFLTPGHTYGGACYLIGNYLFTGDTLFMEGCGMCNIPGGDARRMFHSLQKLKKHISDDVIIYPGHQYQRKIGKTFADVKASNVYLNFKTEEELVKFRMRKGQKGLLDFT
jgi:hydroxyacylglutathione hydrolase